MEIYEVKYQVCPAAGNAVLMTNTVETSSPEHAKKMVYSMLFRSKPSKAKVKFMYVRRLTHI
ncbi:hypothetical protein [Sporomusa acidovorans]|uniref:Uncharacterized protein n=1 Tax=Sporomusa acidovorans (strain ATCC 49682 / DSM 3132 / Mol) TaxID=1123286 RepID=A0ABZ3IZL2_SPOA4|nr:hypothetical protein [Sporomusa acidovorans]OZC14182.1 hypothetical protein SPACI_53570 [Sporomusa acidovorans DSM 3132]SDE70597.1 hypothetical protein SAMN04488499_101978 [Sporomusa acidovorans]